MKPEIELIPQGPLHCLGFRLNIPRGHPDCPSEAEVQEDLEVALMELLMRLIGLDAEKALKGATVEGVRIGNMSELSKKGTF